MVRQALARVRATRPALRSYFWKIVPKIVLSKNVLCNIKFILKTKKSDILTKTKTFGRSWPLLILYLGHFTFKNNDINLKWPFFSIAKEISLDQRSLACDGHLIVSLIFYFYSYFYLLDYLPTSNKGIVQNKVVQFNGVHVPSVARLDNDRSEYWPKPKHLVGVDRSRYFILVTLHLKTMI
jgi:hypothetical protein